MLKFKIFRDSIRVFVILWTPRPQKEETCQGENNSRKKKETAVVSRNQIRVSASAVVFFFLIFRERRGGMWLCALFNDKNNNNNNNNHFKKYIKTSLSIRCLSYCSALWHTIAWHDVVIQHPAHPVGRKSPCFFFTFQPMDVNFVSVENITKFHSKNQEKRKTKKKNSCSCFK
jgi:hypothetical protein